MAPDVYFRIFLLLLTGIFCIPAGCSDKQATSTRYFQDVTDTYVPYAPRAHPLEAAFVDVDGDGDPDVILAMEASPNLLYINDGSGKLSWVKDVFSSASHDTEHLRVADFDGDGHIDVIFVAEDDQNHEYYLGNGDGTFRNVSNRLPAKSEGNGLDVGDVNGDGLPDMVVGNSGEAGQNFLWINDPQRPGYFIDRSAYDLPQVNDATQAIKLADLDGDGDLDMVVGNEVPPNRLLLNDGKGVFTEASDRLDLPVPLHTRDILVFDANGDGYPDIIFANLTSNGGAWEKDPRMRILINDGHARFTDETAARMPENKFSTYAATVMDIDRDGHPDILLGAIDIPGFHPMQLHAYRNDGKGYFTDVTAEVIPAVTVGRTWGSAVGDLNGDGINDLFIGGWRSQARLLLGK